MSMAIDRIIKSAEKSVKFGDLDAARAACEQGLETHPQNPRLNALAERLEKAGIDSKEAGYEPPQAIIEELEFLSMSSQWVILIQRCLELLEDYSDSPVIWNFLGVGQRAKNYPLLAETAHRKAIELDPKFFAGYCNLGNVLKDLRNYAEAEEAHRISAKLNPFDARPHNNLGSLYEDVGQYDHAFESFTKAVSLDPGFATAEYNLGGVNLRRKNFPLGWQQRECRWKRQSDDQEIPIETTRPLWDGSFVDRLYVWAEQGVGDEIMFGSCFHDLRQRCNELFVSCTPRILPLFERSFKGQIKFVDRHIGLPDHEYDYQAPALTALGYVRRHIDDFKPGNTPFLRVDEGFVDSIRAAIKQVSGSKPIVGISWFSSNKKLGKARSMPVTDLVASIPEDVFLLNLQYGDVADDLREVERQLNRGVASFDNIDNWSQLDLFAALITACDKVVSVDNSTVHFAGALGKECHVLLPYAADWRWGSQGEGNSYWYQSVKLHWQSTLHDWSDAFISLNKALNENSPSGS